MAAVSPAAGIRSRGFCEGAEPRHAYGEQGQSHSPPVVTLDVPEAPHCRPREE
jgi:hypothetical protein